MTPKAVALKYDQDTQSAPKVVASGKGAIASKIIEKAKEFDIAIFQNTELVNSLIDLDLNKEIPAELYEALVEVFIWLAKQESSLK